MIQQFIDSLPTFEYPDSPHKPTLARDHTLADIQAYERDFKAYLEAFEQYQQKRKEWHENEKAKENAIKQELMKCISRVPEKYKQKVWDFADTNTDNWVDMENMLDELAQIFL